MNNGTELKKSAQAVQDVLRAHGLDCKVVEFPVGTRTAADAAAAVGSQLGQISKTLIFKTKNSHRPVLISASGKNRVNEKKVSQEIGEKLARADAEFVRKATGFAIGGVSPFAHPHKIELAFVDQDLLKFEEVWVAAGTPNAVFKMKSKDLVELTDSKVISIV